MNHLSSDIAREQRRAVVTAIANDAIAAAKAHLVLGNTDDALQVLRDATQRLIRLGAA